MYYFDNAATTFPKPEEVYSFMDKFYREYGVNVGRGQYKITSIANNLVEDTRLLLLKMFGCINKKVVFTHSATESINVILQGINWENGFNVYISPFEHNAVTRVLNYISKIYRINIYQLKVNKEKIEYEVESIKYQFQDNRPNLVIINHGSNVCGVIAPVEEIFEMAKSYEAITVLDTAQTAGLIDMNLEKIKVDYAVFVGHKSLYGPFGVGGFIQSIDVKLKPLLFGGTGIDSANENLPDNVPERYEIGSKNIQAIAGLNAALKWIDETGINNIYEHEKKMTFKLLELLGQFNNIKIFSPKDNSKIGVTSCVFEDYSSNEIGQILNNNNIAVRTGLHCAPGAHKFLGTFPEGTVRFSISYFNCDTDIMVLNKALDFIYCNR